MVIHNDWIVWGNLFQSWSEPTWQLLAAEQLNHCTTEGGDDPQGPATKLAKLTAGRLKMAAVLVAMLTNSRYGKQPNHTWSKW